MMPDSNLFQSLQQTYSSNTVRYSKYIAATITSLWILGQFIPAITKLFALIPANIMYFYFWTFLTAGFYETSFVMGFINIIVFILVAPMLERNWTGKVFIKFLAVVNVCIMLTIFLWMIGCYATTGYEACIFRAVCGLSGINAAFAVALKQKFPDRPVFPLAGISFFQFQHLPAVIVCIAIVMWGFGKMGGKESPLVLFGTFYSWIYLRFYLVDQDTGIVGDLRSEFSLASFFPNIAGIRPVIVFISTIVFQALIRTGLFAEAVKTNPVEKPIEAENEHFYRTSAATDPNAERRRLLAIKAIDDKLAELSRQTANTQTYQPADSTIDIASYDVNSLDDNLPSDADLARLEREVTSGANAV